MSYPGGDEISSYTSNYANWRLYPIRLGDEADAWGGIQDSPTNPPENYEMQIFRIRWRHGPIVSTIFVYSAHDLTLDTALHFAHIVDAHIASALQQATTGAVHASDRQEMTTSASASLAVRALDRRPVRWIRWIGSIGQLFTLAAVQRNCCSQLQFASLRSALLSTSTAADVLG